MAIVIAGDQGVGKDILWDFFMHHVFGPDQSLQTADPGNDVFGRFANLSGKVFIVVSLFMNPSWRLDIAEFFSIAFRWAQVDEDVISQTKNSEQFKNFVTSGEIRVEGKGKPMFHIINTCNFITTTNFNKKEMGPEFGDRRCCYFLANPCRKGNKAYFDNLGRFLRMPQIPRVVYDFLMQHRDLEKYKKNFQTERPITDFYREMQVRMCCVLSPPDFD